MTKWKSAFGPGVYLNMSNELYHADPAISSTDIKELLSNPLEYWFNNWMNPNKPPSVSTTGMRLGNAYHTMLLEPEKFDYEILSDQKTTTRPGCLASDEYDTLRNMQMMFDQKPYHAALLKNGYAEVSVFWDDAMTGLPCKCRLDYWKPHFVTDLKTTAKSVHHRDLRYMIPDMGYDVSAAMYSNGMDALRAMIKSGHTNIDPRIDQTFIDEFLKSETRFVFLIQSKEPPYITRAQAVTEPIYECGNDKFRKGMMIAKTHFDQYGTNQWPDGYEKIENMEIENLSSSIHYF